MYFCCSSCAEKKMPLISRVSQFFFLFSFHILVDHEIKQNEKKSNQPSSTVFASLEWFWWMLHLNRINAAVADCVPRHATRHHHRHFFVFLHAPRPPPPRRAICYLTKLQQTLSKPATAKKKRNKWQTAVRARTFVDSAWFARFFFY